MKILVTGGTGLVGKALHKSIDNENDWVFVSSKDANLLDLDETKKLFEKYKPNKLIHLAASVGGLFKNIDSNLEMFEKNLIINLNVIKCCHKYNINRAIFCLSTCVFPNKVNYPITEDQLHIGEPHESNFGYAYSKRILEIHCRLYNKTYNRNYICISPTNIYGENDNFSLKDSHVIPGLIHQCYLSKKNNTKFIVKGTGKPLRQFLYSKDLAKIIIHILFKENFNDHLIISPIEEISIKNLAEIISSIFNHNNIEFDHSYSDGQFKKSVSNEKMLQVIPNFKFTSLNQGIINTIYWFKNNYENIRK